MFKLNISIGFFLLQTKVQENIRAARQARIAAQAADSNIDINELDRTLVAIIEACTKDNITVKRIFFSNRIHFLKKNLF